MILTNKLNLPQPFVDAATNDHEYTEGRYSVTELLGGTCEAILKRRHSDELTDDVADMVWAIFGSAVHEILQNADESESQLKENWIDCQLDGSLSGYSLSGIFDLYDDSTGIVTDYKTASVWKVQFGDFDDWRKQTLMYCWLLQQIGFDAWTGRIVALLKDHSIRKARTEKGYPEHPVVTLEWRFSNADMEQIEDEIYRWFAIVAAQNRLADDDLTPCDEQQRWHKPDKWAVMKKGNKRAVRVYADKGDAYQRAAGENREAGKELYYVEERMGEDTKCDSYCSVSDFCPFARAKKSDV